MTSTDPLDARGPGSGDPASRDLAAAPLVHIVRSKRRSRTISGYRDGDRTVVRVPAGLSAADEKRFVDDMLARLARKEARTHRARPGDGDLARRAAELSREFLDGRARPSSVRWVSNQNSRWGSCTPANRTIRLSHRLRTMPSWVVDYVLVHELAHLLVHSHGPDFWALVERYPRTERARGYLEGVVVGAGLDVTSDADEGPEDATEDTPSSPSSGGSLGLDQGQGPAA